MATLARVALVVVGLSIVGGWAVCFCFFTFFSSVDYNCAGVSPDVDDIEEITIRVVKGVANL